MTVTVPTPASTRLITSPARLPITALQQRAKTRVDTITVTATNFPDSGLIAREVIRKTTGNDWHLSTSAPSLEADAYGWMSTYGISVLVVLDARLASASESRFVNRLVLSGVAVDLLVTNGTGTPAWVMPSTQIGWNAWLTEPPTNQTKPRRTGGPAMSARPSLRDLPGDEYTLPTSGFTSFLADCKEVLPPDRYRHVHGVFTRAYDQTAATLTTQRRVLDGSTAYRDMTDAASDADTADDVLTVIRAVQAAWLMHVNRVINVSPHAVAAIPAEAQRTEITPAHWSALPAASTTRATAATALFLTGIDVRDMTDYTVNDIQELLHAPPAHMPDSGRLCLNALNQAHQWLGTPPDGRAFIGPTGLRNEINTVIDRLGIPTTWRIGKTARHRYTAGSTLGITITRPHPTHGA